MDDLVLLLGIVSTSSLTVFIGIYLSACMVVWEIKRNQERI